MASIQFKRFNWLRRPTAWEQAQAWRSSRRAMAEKFQTGATLASNGFLTASVNQIQGMALLAAQAAMKQVQGSADQLRSKVDKLA